jgi:hypothetical protein
MAFDDEEFMTAAEVEAANQELAIKLQQVGELIADAIRATFPRRAEGPKRGGMHTADKITVEGPKEQGDLLVVRVKVPFPSRFVEYGHRASGWYEYARYTKTVNGRETIRNAVKNLQGEIHAILFG